MTYHPYLNRKGVSGQLYGDVLKFVTGGFTINPNHIIEGPGLVYRPIPESSTQPLIEPRSAILHTNAGGTTSKSLWAWITRASVTGEPHFQIGYAGGEQYMPMNRRADCNYTANRWLQSGKWFGAISFETQDNGGATVEITPWTAQQVRMMVNILTCICVVYGVQCSQPGAWNDSGIGHHSLFPFQGVGSKAWTNVRGKTCPGRARKAQMDYVRSEVAKNLAAFGEVTGWKCGGTR